MDYLRRMAIIVFSDIKKSTEKMELDENLMVKLLRDHEDVFRKISLQYGGRIVKNRGDGFMIEFSAASQAVKCCINIQKAFRKYNAGKPENERILVRIGIHMGDVVQEKTDLLGIAVNIAARLEPLAEPGGICISRHVYDSVKSSMKLNYIDMGLKELKGISEPRRCYGIVEFTDDQENTEEIKPEKSFDQKKTVKISPLLENSSREGQAAKIVILPFKVMSSKPEDSYLGEGFASALSFELSSEQKLFVQPFESVLAVDTNAQDPQYMHSIFGADYVVSGSIQKFGPVLRLQVNLVNAVEKRDMYSEAIKTNEEKLLDENLTTIARSILFNIISQVSDEIQASLSMTRPASPIASTLYLKGSYLDRKAVSWDDKKRAISTLEKAVKADRNYPLARIALAKAYAGVHGRWKDDPTWFEKAQKEAQTGYDQNPDLFETNEALGRIELFAGNIDEAEMYIHQALVLRPESSGSQQVLSFVYLRQGKLEEARTILEEAVTASDLCGDRLNHAVLLNQIATIDRKQGFFSKALGLYNEALAIARNTGNRYLEGGISLNIGTVFQNMGKRESAIENFNRSVKTLREAGDKKYIAATLGNIGQALASMGTLQPALEHFREALDISRTIGDVFTEANILTQQGYVLNGLGRNQEAVEAYQAALETHRKNDNRLKEANVLNNLAALYCDLGQHEEALLMYTQSRDIAAEAKNFPLLASVHLNIGEIHELQNDYEQALENYQIAEQVFNQIEAGQYLPYLYLFRGRVHFNAGNYESAREDFRKGFDCQHIQSSVKLRITLYDTLCRIRMGEQIEWLPILEETAAELEKIGSYPEWIEGLRVIGWWMAEHGSVDRGKEHLCHALKLASESGMSWEVTKIETLLDDS